MGTRGTRKDALLDLLLVERRGLRSEVVIGGHLGHSDLRTIEFKSSLTG